MVTPQPAQPQLGPHGWALTRTGTTMHYFLAPSQCALPVALCHNAIQAAPGSQLVPKWTSGVSGLTTCPTCQERLEQWQRDKRKLDQVLAAQAAGRLAPGVPVRVLSGKYKDYNGEVTRREPSQENFWWVTLLANGKVGKNLLFSESQLQIK